MTSVSRQVPEAPEVRQRWYFTFGVGQPNAGRYFVVEDATNEEARQRMFDRFGREWAFQYDEQHWHRDGVSQAERYGLEVLSVSGQVPEEATVRAYDERPHIVGGITNNEARALARGVAEMTVTIEGLREDLARVEKARAKWAALSEAQGRVIDALEAELRAYIVTYYEADQRDADAYATAVIERVKAAGGETETP